MPNYIQHDAFNFTAGILIAIVILNIFFWCGVISIWQWIGGCIGYIFGVLFFSPDLDTDSKPLHRWRKLSLIWRLYHKVAKHRGISHTPILGTISRILYLFCWFFPFFIIYLCIPNLPSLGNFAKENWKFIVVFVGMIFIADLFHILLDHIYPHLKVKA